MPGFLAAGSKLASLGKSVWGVTAANPISSTIAGVGGTGLFAGEMLAPFAKAVKQDPLGQEIKATVHERIAAMTAKARQRRLKNAMRENEARLAALTPDLYAMLVAGERLPIGGRMFGGVPQRELVNATTLKMAKGEFNERTAEDDLRDLLTG